MEPLENNPEVPDRWAGLKPRILSAAALGALALLCVWQGGMLFAVFVLLAALVMKKEWDALIKGQSLTLRAVGYAYIILPCSSLIWLRNLPGETGLITTAALIAVISATDMGAFFVGRRFGHYKLSPTISPSKTWEGLAGGTGAAMVTALLLSPYVPVQHSVASALVTGLITSLLAQAGDLFESFIKRQAEVKDSGTLLPGHGGLLDRFDGYMFATPVFALLIHFALPA